MRFVHSFFTLRRASHSRVHTNLGNGLGLITMAILKLAALSLSKTDFISHRSKLNSPSAERRQHKTFSRLEKLWPNSESFASLSELHTCDSSFTQSSKINDTRRGDPRMRAQNLWNVSVQTGWGMKEVDTLANRSGAGRATQELCYNARAFQTGCTALCQPRPLASPVTFGG